MKSLLLVSLILMTTQLALGQGQSNENPVQLTIKGFVKTDVMADSRQTVTAREGHFLLYPAAEVNDPNGDDINAKPNLNMLSIQTRLTGTITGPDALGAKTSGVIEGAFFGHSNADVNGFRLRHAYLKLDWESSTLLIGQYWHPMFITEVFPGVISFNTGVPFQPFSRNPQIRWIQKINPLEITIVAASQRDFTSTGPAGASSSYLRNSAIPILDLNVKMKTDQLVAGAGINFKSIVPQLSTVNGFATDESINSLSYMAFAKLTTETFTWKVESIYGSNLTDLLMLGGYAVSKIEAVEGHQEYTGIQTFSVWTEVLFGDEINVGVFTGYTQNQGAGDNIVGATYANGSNIDHVWRVSPRMIYKTGNVQFAGEVEYTAAAYGTAGSKGVVKNTTNVSNIRLLLAAYLFF